MTDGKHARGCASERVPWCDCRGLQTPWPPQAAIPPANKHSWCYLTTSELHRLDVAVTPLKRMAPMGVYLVGSVNERPDFRDVDVRMILADEDWDARFLNDPFMWEAFCYAWSRVLSDDTGLRIDFQVQRMTQANENHVQGTRHPLTGGSRPFAGRGDATLFPEPPRD